MGDHARLTPNLDLTGAQLAQAPEALSCKYLTVQQLRLPRVPVGGTVDLSHAALEMLEADPRNTPAGICTEELTYTKLSPLLSAPERIDWLKHQEGYLPQSYEQLAAAYRRLGHDADARTVLLAKERRRRQNSRLPVLLWGVLQDITTGTDIGRPRRPLARHAAGSRHGNLCAPPADSDQQGYPPEFNPCFYTLDLLLPVVTYGQQSAFGPTGVYQWLAYSFMTAGWLLAVTVIAGITRIPSRN